MSALDNGRISLAAGSFGIAQGSLDASIQYANERKQFGNPIPAINWYRSFWPTPPSRPTQPGCWTWRAATKADAGEKGTRMESSHG